MAVRGARAGLWHAQSPIEVLPLIEFVPEASISDEEALDLIKEFPEDKNSGEGKEADHYVVGDRVEIRHRHAIEQVSRRWREI